MEEENIKRYYGDDHSIRSTADRGGQQLTKGLEHQMLHEIKAQGELQDFINVLKVLEQYPEVKAKHSSKGIRHRAGILIGKLS